MSLFNEYKNKNFTYLTKYINLSIVDDEKKSSVDIKENLVGEKLLTYEDIVDELMNTKENINENASIFYTDDYGNLLPIIADIQIPIRATIAERAWLYYYLDKPEARLFLDEEVIKNLKEKLEFKRCEERYPLNDSTYTVREMSTKNDYTLTPTVIGTFRTILDAIHEKRYIITDNNVSNSKTYQDSVLIPFRFEYRNQTGNICLSAYSPEMQRCLMLNIFKLSNTRIGDVITDYEHYCYLYNESLNSKYVDIPVTIKITDYYNGFDRAVYTFSNFKRESYRDEDNNIIMKIYYHRTFEREIITKLLFLGPAITVLGPNDIVSRYVTILRESLQNYQD